MKKITRPTTPEGVATLLSLAEFLIVQVHDIAACVQLAPSDAVGEREHATAVLLQDLAFQAQVMFEADPEPEDDGTLWPDLDDFEDREDVHGTWADFEDRGPTE